jgi:hypothetical protein
MTSSLYTLKWKQKGGNISGGDRTDFLNPISLCSILIFLPITFEKSLHIFEKQFHYTHIGAIDTLLSGCRKTQVR